MGRIIDATGQSGVYAGRLLAEAGHEVIRVEPRSGDAIRRLGPYLGGVADLEHGAYHQFFNAGKKSCTVALDTPAGERIMEELCRDADAVLVSEAIAIDGPHLLKANPRLVVTTIGDDEKPEICAYAKSGLLSITGHPGERPVQMGGFVYYAATGLYTATATGVGLLVSQTSGRGQQVRVSVAQCLQSLVEQAMVTYVSTGKGTERRGFRGAVSAVSGAFPCADGYWMVSLSASGDGWKRFMDWIQDPVLAADESLADEAERSAKRDMVLDRIETWARGHKKDDLVEESQRRHIPSAPVTTPFDLARDPQLIARGFLREREHPDFGKMLFPVGAIASLRGSDLGFAPRLGEHTGEILGGLGYSASEQQALFESGVI